MLILVIVFTSELFASALIGGNIVIKLVFFSVLQTKHNAFSSALFSQIAMLTSVNLHNGISV